ncbi:uncharacterized protein TRIVIDRAFT_74082 [Trichoderma virens Gv29-8]|uniref:WSC domain-containing protein n=1 Tax=Hypocrea virens (strain Gv29-8 / FGSC 10586) TaxID=413071 RepID=G9MNJ0_HYPVG|nr:uncharacterized protein TRIVIDRAFT_74082 [Trichoderma virens Gv29-8]EHK23446.1 hypothetical protein TRIVIDRAFT_74082 [Trichoderma virens Gv29-8]UKZ49747.1 hypothetical protein TrVGV298_003997 [Trichoderma virens]
MKSSTILSGALVAATQVYTAIAATPLRGYHHDISHVIRASTPAPTQPPVQPPVPNAYRSQGCWSSKGNMTQATDVKSTTVSSGACNLYCSNNHFPVSGLQGDECFCGFAYPPEDTQVDTDKCTFPCPAYPQEACGALGHPGFFSIYNTGVNINPPNYEPPSSSSSSSSSSSTSTTSSGSEKSSSASSPSGPASQSAEATPTDAPPSSGKKTNVAGIAAGTVVGVVVLGGLIGAALFTMRRRRNAEIEEEHRRNAAVNAFINGSKPPSTSGSISMTDSRLDPIMAHRRLSDGSIADNEDYSRRILRVTNA